MIRRCAALGVLLLTACTSGGAVTSTSRPTLLPVTSAPAPVLPSASGPSRVAALLAGIPTKGRAPKTGYDRDRFGPAWTDDNDDDFGHNGCDTRNDILRRDLRHVVLKPDTQGCVVLTGQLDDPYTGHVIAFTRGERTSDALLPDEPEE